MFGSDQHVCLYGKPHNQKLGGPLLIKTLTGSYGYTDENGHDVAAANHLHHNGEGELLARRYPSLPIGQFLNAFAAEQQWCIESIRISHVQLLGTHRQFQKLAHCLTQCHTLKTIIVGDSRTDFLLYSAEDEEQSMCAVAKEEESQRTLACSGLDAMVSALAKASQLQEVSLQNVPELSSEALWNLCQSTSIEKLQLLLSQSVLPTGCITGDYIRPMTQSLQHNQTMKELRIFGVLDCDACWHVSQMLLVNTALQKLALKIKLTSSESTIQGNDAYGSDDEDMMDMDHSDNSQPSGAKSSETLPLLSALASPFCSLTSLEIYISGSRADLEKYATAFAAALRLNQSLTQLNVVFYGLDTFLATSTTLSVRGGGGALAAMRTNELWMSRLTEILQHGNYTLHQILINHGMLELSDAVKLYLRLNRAGRRHLLTASNEETSTGSSAALVRRSEIDLWVETLARVRNDLSCLFYFLSCNPSMFCRQDAHRGERARSSLVSYHYPAPFIAWSHEDKCRSPPLNKQR
jgi:hypothetical protein